MSGEGILLPVLSTKIYTVALGIPMIPYSRPVWRYMCIPQCDNTMGNAHALVYKLCSIDFGNNTDIFNNNNKDLFLLSGHFYEWEKKWIYVQLNTTNSEHWGCFNKSEAQNQTLYFQLSGTFEWLQKTCKP